MTKQKNTSLTVMILGIFSIIAGGYQLYVGADFQDYFFGISLGITLVGTAFFNKEQLDKVS